MRPTVNIPKNVHRQLITLQHSISQWAIRACHLPTFSSSYHRYLLLLKSTTQNNPFSLYLLSHPLILLFNTIQLKTLICQSNPADHDERCIKPQERSIMYLRWSRILPARGWHICWDSSVSKASRDLCTGRRIFVYTHVHTSSLMY